MPKFHRGLDRFDLLSELNDLAWWYDELAEMAKIVSGEEARVGAIEPMMRREGEANSEGVPPAYADQPSPGSRTNTSTTTRKRPTVDDPLEESLHAKLTQEE